MVRKITIWVALALFLPGCASMTQHAMGGILGSWQGEPVTKVVSVWGQPTQTFAGTETTMYQWTDSARLVPWKVGEDMQRNTEQPGAALIKGSCTRQLIVANSDGTVQSGTYHGDNCCVAAAAGYCKSLKNPERS